MNISLSRLESLFRNAFGLAGPVLISLGIIYAAIFFWEYRQLQEKEYKQMIWAEKAEIVLASARSDLTYSDLFTSYGNNLSNAIESHGSKEFSTDLVAKGLNKHFPPEFIGDDSLLWLFSVNNGKVRAQAGPGFEKSRLRVMEMLVNGLIDLANDQKITSARISSIEKFTRGILGPHSAPLYLGKNREGRLTPVIFDAKPYYFYWRQFKQNDTTFGVILAVVPASKVENKEFSLQHLASRILDETRKHFAAAFIPARGMEKKLSIILPVQFDSDPEYKKRIINYLHQVQSNQKHVSEMDNKKTRKSKILQIGDHFFLKDFTSIDLPYDAVIFAPRPEILKFQKVSLLPLTLMVLFAWFLIYLAFYLHNGRPGLPMAVSFRLLFVFSGILSIFFMLSIGFDLVEKSYISALQELRQEHTDKLSDINEKSDTLLPSYGSNISMLINQLNLQPLLTSSNREDMQKAFDLVRNSLRKIELSIDCILVFRPGHTSEMLFHDQRLQASLKMNMDFLAPSGFKVNRAFTNNAVAQDIVMDTAQKNLFQIMNSFSNDFIEELFLLSYGKESFVKFGDNNRDYYYSVNFSEKGRIKSYVIFIAKSENLLRDYLVRELDSLNVSASSMFIAAEEQNNSNFSIFRCKSMNIINSKTGRNAVNFLRKCRSSIFEKHITDLDYLYIFYPLSKFPNLSGGCIVSLARINSERDLKLLALLSVSVIFACLMYIMASLAASYVLDPFRHINSIILKISQGNLDCRTQVTSNNELGLLAATINLMLSGFKKRLRLGKYVSSTLDQSLATTNSIEATRTARKISGTVLFSDIRDFTTLSESHPPAEIATMLNNHLEAMASKIQAHGGLVEQFIGDAIVGFFPDNQPDDSKERAIAAAIDMSMAHRLICSACKENSLTYNIGIGLEHGQLMAGPLLTASRSEFAIIGKAKADAEKLEQLSKKGRHSKIIISKNLLSSITDPANFSCEPLLNTSYFELILDGGKE